MTPKTKYVLKGTIIATVIGVWFLGIFAPVVGALIAFFMWNKKQKAAAEAAVGLGRQYYDGDGVEKDIRKAFECWSQNIEALDAESALKLADMYRDGEVTEKDLKKAFPLYQKASRQDAEQRIMDIFEQGTDLPEYTRYAAESYTRRFENGEDELLDKLIALYTRLGDGENLKKYQIIAAKKGDRTLAAKWGKELFETDKSAAYPLLCSADGDGDPEIFFMRACILETGDGAEQNLAAAKEYYQKAMDAGYEPASRHLAPLLLKSADKSEREQAFSLYSAWADHGDADAKFKVADMLARGIGTAPDAAGALAIWRNLVETGCHAALLKIAEAYHAGSGCERDLAQAMEFAEKAVAAKVKGAKKLLDELKEEKDAEIRAEKEAILNAAIAACDNDATGEAELQVARLYEAGKVAAKSPKKAFEYYQKAADKGNAEALFRLGKIAEDGNGTLHLRPDIAQALELYERAGKQGSREAEKALAKIRGKIKELERVIIADYGVITGTQGGIDRTKLHNLEDFLPEYFEYEIPRSLTCAMHYRKYLVKNDRLNEEYPDSDEVRDLAIGFLSADLAGDSEKCWHYARKLISQGVYWPLGAFIREPMEDGNMEEALPLLCAMEKHGCLEAAAFMPKIREILKAGKNEELQKLYDVSVKQAKKIDAKWLERLSREMDDFPFMYSDPDADETADDAERYSLNDLDEAEKSSDPERREWAESRSEILKPAFLAFKSGDVSVIDKFATLLENVLQQKYESRKYDPHLPIPKMNMSMGGDHLVYLYCNLVWRCHDLGHMRRFKNIFNEENTTDLEYFGLLIDSWRRHRIDDGDMLFGLMAMMTMEDKIYTDEFLYGLE